MIGDLDLELVRNRDLVHLAATLTFEHVCRRPDRRDIVHQFPSIKCTAYTTSAQSGTLPECVARVALAISSTKWHHPADEPYRTSGLSSS